MRNLKFKSILLFILFNSINLKAQPQYTNLYWKVGRHTAIDFRSGTATMDLSDNCTSTIGTTYTQISDRNGQVLFYSNGIAIYNKNDQFVPNADTIGYGYFTDQYVGLDFNPLFKAAVFVPDPADTNMIYLFYENMHSEVDGSYMPSKLFYCKLDKRMNNGNGGLVFKDHIAISNDTLSGGEVLAIKHGNGKDWWIITRKFKSNKYYITLVDETGVHTTNQIIGNAYTFPYAFNGFCAASPNGEELAFEMESYQSTPNYLPSEISIVHLDRCNGALSNYRQLYFPNVSDTIFLSALCFSSNSKILYGHDLYDFYQFDLTASNLMASKTHAIHYHDPNPTPMANMALGPDNKIYISHISSNQYMHVINNPDVLGSGCNFTPNIFNFGGFGHWHDGGDLNIPNYSLAPVAPCGNVGINETPPLATLEIYPNPSSGQTKITVPANTIQLNVFNGIGELIAQYNNPLKAIELNTTTFAKGMYLVEALKSNGKKEVGKMIVSN